MDLIEMNTAIGGCPAHVFLSSILFKLILVILPYFPGTYE